MAILEAALRYAAAGYRVVLLHGVDPKTKRCTCPAGKACAGPGKHPRLRGWPDKATTDASELRTQLARHPHSNIGIMPPEGCVIVDVDPRNGGVRPDGIPDDTPTQRTGGGGEHFIVRAPDGAVLPKLPGVDYRKPDGGQVVVAPSQHVSGGRYAWQTPFTTRPKLWRVPAGRGPSASQAGHGDALGDLLAPMPLSKPPSYSVDRLRAMGNDVRRIAPDQWGAGQHDAWLREWLMVVHHETNGSEEGRALAHEISALFGGYDEEKLNSKWRSLGKRGGEKRTGATLARLLRQLRGAGTAEGLPILQFADFARDARATTWLVRRWLPAGALAVLLGAANSGKSAVTVALSLSVACGAESFVGQPVITHGAVVYIIAEGQDGMRARARCFAESVLGLAPSEFERVPLFFIPVAVSLGDAEQVQQVSERITSTIRSWVRAQGRDTCPVVLVVVDTLARNVGDADENSNTDMSRVMNNCATLQEDLRALDPDRQRPALVLNAHPGHSSPDRVRGAYAVQGAADVILHLTVEKGNVADDAPLAEPDADLLGDPSPVGNVRYLTVTKARDSAPPTALRLRLVADSPAWLRDAQTGTSESTVYLTAHSEFAPLTAARGNRKVSDADVLRAVRDHGAAESLHTLARRLGIARPTLQDRLRGMADRGLLRPKAGQPGRYAVTTKGAQLCV